MFCSSDRNILHQLCVFFIIIIFHPTAPTPASKKCFLLSTVKFLPASGYRSSHIQGVYVHISAIATTKPCKLGALTLIKPLLGPHSLFHSLRFVGFLGGSSMKYSSVALSVSRISWDTFNCHPDWSEHILMGGKHFEQLEGQITPQEELEMLNSLSALNEPLAEF